MSVLICEPEFPTHYHFIEHVVPALTECVEEVVVAVTSTPRDNAHYRKCIKQFESVEGVTILNIFDEPALEHHEEGFKEEELETRLRNFEKMTRVIGREDIKDVLAPTGDKLVPLIKASQLGSEVSPWKRINVHLGIHWLFSPNAGRFDEASEQDARELMTTDPGFASYREKLKDLVSIRPKSVLVQNYLALRFVRDAFPSLRDASYHLPVPIEKQQVVSKKYARAQLGLPVEGRLIGMTGSIQPRKGVVTLLKAFQFMKLAPGTRLLLIGPFEPEIRSLITSQFKEMLGGGELIARDQVMDTRDQHLAISAMDVSVCNLQSHRWSSDIALRAIAADRPIFASDGDWFRYMTETFGVGMTVPVAADIPTKAQRLQQCLARFAAYESTPRTKEIAEFNRPQNFSNTLLSAVLDLERDLIEWPARLN